jgi:hypothetical protein
LLDERFLGRGNQRVAVENAVDGREFVDLVDLAENIVRGEARVRPAGEQEALITQPIEGVGSAGQIQHRQFGFGQSDRAGVADRAIDPHPVESDLLD